MMGYFQSFNSICSLRKWKRGSQECEAFQTSWTAGRWTKESQESYREKPGERHDTAETNTHVPVCESRETQSCRDEHTRTCLWVQRNTIIQRRTHTYLSVSPEKHNHVTWSTQLRFVCDAGCQNTEAYIKLFLFRWIRSSTRSRISGNWGYVSNRVGSLSILHLYCAARRCA